MKKQIWFVRHGESMTNAGRDWTAPDTNPLTETGHKQAQRVCEALSEEPSLIVTSSYVRTKETAGPALARWPDVRHEEWPIHEFASFCHVKHGKISGALWRDHAIALWERGDPDYKDGEHSESFNELMQRIDQTVLRIDELKDEKTIVFSHGFFLGILFFRLMNRRSHNISMRDVWEYRQSIHIPNTSISHFSFNPNGSVEMHSITADHLSDDEQNLKGY